ncbi:MAG: monooxygenase [Betaproteobacteria bacterium]|nr:monooxygenase [Betaproteobacteria bacterium]NBY05159.1 monooxygenase [Betaproteobacteria bacterium]
MAVSLDSPVLIVGAGPVGLITALVLAQQGIASRVIEAEPGLTIDLRAGTFHPPTLEMLDGIGVADEMRAAGIAVRYWQSRDLQEGLVAEWDLDLLRHDTPYPYRLHLEQHRLTPIVLQHVQRTGLVDVVFGHRFEAQQSFDDHVVVTAQGPDGLVEWTTQWLIAADGGRSQVRKSAHIEFAGYTWPERYSVLSTTFDFATLGYRENAYMSDPVQWSALFKMPDAGPPGLWRMTLPVDSETPEAVALAGPYAQQAIRRITGADASTSYPLVHQSIYSVHQRVAVRFRQGRVLLAGDAAHVNNPLGGFGLNSGIHDAISLGHALSRVLQGMESDEALERYNRQRQQANVAYVQELSVRNKKNLEEKDPQLRAQRMQELRAVCADPDKARQYLLNSSMINSIRRAQTVA